MSESTTMTPVSACVAGLNAPSRPRARATGSGLAHPGMGSTSEPKVEASALKGKAVVAMA